MVPFIEIEKMGDTIFREAKGRVHVKFEMPFRHLGVEGCGQLDIFNLKIRVKVGT